MKEKKGRIINTLHISKQCKTCLNRYVVCTSQIFCKKVTFQQTRQSKPCQIRKCSVASISPK